MEMGGLGYDVGIVLHLAGIVLLGGAMVTELVAGLLLRRAKSMDQVELVMSVFDRLPKLFGAASAVIFLSGIYLSWLHIHGGGALGWLVVAVLMFVAMGAYSSWAGRRFDDRLRQAVRASRHGFSPALIQLKSGAHMQQTLGMGACMFLGILILMVFQPTAANSIVTAIICAAAGLVVGQYMAPSDTNQSSPTKPAKQTVA